MFLLGKLYLKEFHHVVIYHSCLLFSSRIICCLYLWKIIDLKSKASRFSCRSLRTFSLNIYSGYVVFYYLLDQSDLLHSWIVHDWKMPAVSKIIFSPSWSNLEILINSIMMEICFTRGLSELNFKGDVAPSPLREVLWIILTLYKAFGGGNGGKHYITQKLF